VGIDRRSLFASAAGAAAHAAAPRWLRPFFGQDPAPTPTKPSERERQLRAAAAQAKAQGKPLLVFVVPAEEAAAHQRGQWLGAWLLHGGAAARLDVAMCVPAAATATELTALSRVVFSGELAPLQLVDAAQFEVPDVPALRLTPVEVNLPATDPPARKEDLACLTTGLSAAIATHVGTPEDLDRNVRAALAEADVRRVTAWLRGGARPDDELLVRTAAWIRCAMASMSADQKARTQASLLAAVDRLWLQRPLPGARWGRSEGCGTDIEDPNASGGLIPSAIDCGMAHVPEICQRFLVFYTGS